MTKRKNRRPRKSRGAAGPPPHLAVNAAMQALRRATLAAASGKLTAADREMRLAERLDKLGRSPLLESGKADEPEQSGDAFRLELEHRINRHRAEQRALKDDLKRADPARWQAEFDAAVEDAVAAARAATIAFWTGDPHLFEEPAAAPQAS